MLIWIGAALIIGGAAYYFRAAILEKIKGWRTIIFNILAGSTPAVTWIATKLADVDWTQVATPLNAILLGIAFTGIGVWLRCLTIGPVGSKGDEEPAPATRAGD